MDSKKVRLVSTALFLASMLLFASATLYAYYQIFNIGRIKTGPEDPLEAWSEASYIIWKYNSTHYAARNMSTLLVDYLGTDATTVIETVLNASTNGGRIFIKRGAYEIATTIDVYNKYFTIFGEGPGSSGTRLYLADGANVNMFNLHSSTFFNLYDVSLDGNNANNNAGIGISASDTKGGEATADITIQRVFVHHFADEGIYWENCWGSVILNSYIEANYGHGAQIGGWNNHIESSTFNWNNLTGLRIGGDFHTSVVDNAISENGEHGIYVSGGSTTIVGNKVLGNGVNANDTYHGIYIYGGLVHTITGNLVDGRTVKNPPRYNTTRNGIRVDNVVTGVSIEDNTIVRTLSAAIYTSVPDKTEIHSNIGFITEHSGTAEASNDDWVSFGVTFAGTPQAVLLTVQEDGTARYIVQVKAKNTTHFQLYIYDETAGAVETVNQTISWYAEYKP